MASGTIETKTIWMNGELVDAAEATIPFLTSGLHYGIGVFEGIRCYATREGPAVFRLREHIDRLLDSATCLGFRELPWSAEDLIAAVDETVRANGFDECYIRPLIWLGGGGWNLNLDGGTPGLGIAVWPWKDYLGAEGLEKGVRANVSSVTRHHPNVTATKAKISGNYVNSFLAKTESVRLGFEEAIQLDASGYVAECTGANIFLVRDGRIVTPPAALVLEGITRDSIITLAGDLGFTVEERPVSRDQLYIADEVFVSGTAAECVALREIDFRTIGAGVAGPVTRALQKAYHAAVRGDHPRSDGWCHRVTAAEPRDAEKRVASFGRRR
ncbi:MAG: branched-chain amino acid transaminase [Acidithiobacillales bacterium]